MNSVFVERRPAAPVGRTFQNASESGYLRTECSLQADHAAGNTRYITVDAEHSRAQTHMESFETYVLELRKATENKQLNSFSESLRI